MWKATAVAVAVAAGSALAGEPTADDLICITNNVELKGGRFSGLKTSAPRTCFSDNEGLMYFDATEKQLMVCDGASFEATKTALHDEITSLKARLDLIEMPRSCKEVKLQDAGADSGVFRVDPDGYGGPMPPMDVFCDMLTEGGGWTMVMAVLGSDRSNAPLWRTVDSVEEAACQDLSMDTTCKFSDALINAFLTEGEAGRYMYQDYVGGMGFATGRCRYDSTTRHDMDPQNTWCYTCSDDIKMTNPITLSVDTIPSTTGGEAYGLTCIRDNSVTGDYKGFVSSYVGTDPMDLQYNRYMHWVDEATHADSSGNELNVYLYVR